MKCKNCGHDIEVFWEGYVDAWDNRFKAPLYAHKKGPKKKPVRFCFCGCDKPEPLLVGKVRTE